MSKKQILDGYVGVKFEAHCVQPTVPKAVAEWHSTFKTSGERLGGYGMAPANGGNMSARLEEGFVVTASGCNLGAIESDELIWVQKCDVDHQTVHYCGPIKPSSESILHHLVLEARPDAGAVVHAHDPVAAREAIESDGLAETAREEPYGTIALAELAIEAFGRNQEIIVLRNHGYVCAANTMTEAIDRIIATHLRLLNAQG
jgi:ribulose-5-phosphate 4-epimerase/fuculose-1-phosphate aldolase